MWIPSYGAKPAVTAETVTRGKEQGDPTYAEVNDHLPEDIVDSDQIKTSSKIINDMGIQVMEEAPDADDRRRLKTPRTKMLPKPPRRCFPAWNLKIGRTTDPVRCTCVKWAPLQPSTREGEIDIAKRIEDGITVQCSVAEYPEAITYLLEQYVSR